MLVLLMVMLVTTCLLTNIAHDSGLNLNLYYVNASDAGTDVSYTDYGVTYTGMEGLTLGYGEGDVEANNKY